VGTRVDKVTIRPYNDHGHGSWFNPAAPVSAGSNWLTQTTGSGTTLTTLG
jgi:hypothetical protein